MWHKKITFFENRIRVNSLIEFRNHLVEYFNNIKPSDISGEIIENDRARKLRIELNLKLDKNYLFIISAGINPSMGYLDPIVGISIKNIDAIWDIFNIHRFKGGPQTVIDFIDRAIGVYKGDKISSFLRTINPLFWIGMLFEYIASLPFKIIGKLGFNQTQIEASFIGKLIKGILYLLMVFASLLTVLEWLGLDQKFTTWIKNLLK